MNFFYLPGNQICRRVSKTFDCNHLPALSAKSPIVEHRHKNRHDTSSSLRHHSQKTYDGVTIICGWVTHEKQLWVCCLCSIQYKEASTEESAWIDGVKNRLIWYFDFTCWLRKIAHHWYILIRANNKRISCSDISYVNVIYPWLSRWLAEQN